MTYPASQSEIVECFLEIPVKHLAWSWNTSPAEFEHEWHVNEETYINGVQLTIDHDYIMGYLLECVDRQSRNVNYIAVVCFHGKHPETGYQKHDSIMYDGHMGTLPGETHWPKQVGTFYERNLRPEQACQWGVRVIYGMIDAYHDIQRAERRRNGTD